MAMPRQQTILLVGGTGRTGRQVLHQLLERGVRVRAIVRSGGTFAPDVARNQNLTVIEASLLSLADEHLQRHLRGCDAVISCLGHVLSLKGVLGPPHDLVARATSKLCHAIEVLQPAAPVKFILMSSVSVHRAGGLDTRRGSLEKAFLRLLRCVLPPAEDNQRAADFLHEKVGASNPFVQWTVVRPDSLLPGDVSGYTLHEGLVNGLFTPGSTNMANVAHFMCELATNPKTWADWNARLPVIVNAAASSVAASQST
jgi:NAD(P)-dependent dehydrogenase (short-subunit alcohol dehydrogenase family)